MVSTSVKFLQSVRVRMTMCVADTVDFHRKIAHLRLYASDDVEPLPSENSGCSYAAAAAATLLWRVLSKLSCDTACTPGVNSS